MNLDQRVDALRNLTPVATVRRGLRLENNTAGTALYLYDQIGGWDGIIAKDVVTALNQHRGRPVAIHFNSPGGDIFEGHAIHNAIRRHDGPVVGYVDGIAGSAASYIAMACEALWMEPNAQMMIHDAHGGPPGMSPAQHRETADLLDLLSDSIAEMYAARAGGTAKEWRERMSAETWYNARQTVEAGLASGINGQQNDPEPPGGTTNALPSEAFGGLLDGLKGLFV